MDSKQWAEDLAERVKLRREQQEKHRQLSTTIEELKRKHGAALWDQFREAIKNQADLIMSSLGENDAIRITEKTPNDISCKSRSQHEINAHFDRDKLAVKCLLISTPTTYTVTVADGTLKFQAHDNGRFRNPDEAARDCLEELEAYL